MDAVFEERCGEIFLTINGFMVFHCTLCEEKFNGFEIYSAHIESTHNTAVKFVSDFCADAFYEGSECIKSPKKEIEDEFFEGLLDADSAGVEDSIHDSNPLGLNVFAVPLDTNIAKIDETNNESHLLQKAGVALKALTKPKRKAKKKVKNELTVEASLDVRLLFFQFRSIMTSHIFTCSLCLCDNYGKGGIIFLILPRSGHINVPIALQRLKHLLHSGNTKSDMRRKKKFRVRIAPSFFTTKMISKNT